nr:N-acylneuraminate cytidylyltransferase A [Vanessa tameamea]
MFVKFILFVGVVSPVLSENIAVLILARGGSKGIRLKNIQNIGGISLLGRTILTAKLAGIQDITVSTDHPLIALEGLKYNVSVLKRSYVTSTDWAPSIWGVSEFMETRPEINIVILLQATSPFVNSKHISSSLAKLNFPVSYDCIFAVTRSYKLRWTYIESETKPVNFDYKNRPRRQDWNGEFIETGAFYITRRELIIKGYLQNNK